MGYEGFNSDNSKILATYDEVRIDGITNTHMLLMREYESGRIEFVIGSYFTKKPHMKELGDTGIEVVTEDLMDYEWDWGHYFSNVFSAVDYWYQKVLRLKPADGIDVEFPKNNNGWATCPRCNEDIYDTDRFCSHCGVKINNITK